MPAATPAPSGNGGGPAVALASESELRTANVLMETMAAHAAKTAPPDAPPPRDDDALAVARFLRTTPGLSRSVVGDLLGEPAPRALAVLDAYARSFPWGGVPFEAGLRSFLDGFRLPGEAQKIYRILDAWSLAFYAANAPEAAGAAAGGGGEGKGKEEEGRDAAAAAAAAAPDPSATSTTHPAFASADAVHVLAFSAILLNTDAHSASVRTKMTAAQFVANTRGINGGADLPRAFLEGLYASILAHPVRAPVAAGAEEGGPVAAPSPSGRGWEAGGGGERDRGASPPGGASALAQSTSALARLAGPRRSRSGGWGLGSSGAAAAAPPPPSPPPGGGGRPSSAGGWLLGGGGGGKPAGGGAPKRRWWGGCLGPA